ncbi:MULTISPECIES: putative leader peptide [Actinopolyspora alba group]
MAPSPRRAPALYLTQRLHVDLRRQASCVCRP